MCLVVALRVDGKIIFQSDPFTDRGAADKAAQDLINKAVASGGSIMPDKPTWN